MNLPHPGFSYIFDQIKQIWKSELLLFLILNIDSIGKDWLFLLQFFLSFCIITLWFCFNNFVSNSDLDNEFLLSFTIFFNVICYYIETFVSGLTTLFRECLRSARRFHDFLHEKQNSIKSTHRFCKYIMTIA